MHACFACVGAKVHMPTGLSHVGSENLAIALLTRHFLSPQTGPCHNSIPLSLNYEQNYINAAFLGKSCLFPVCL